MSVSFCLTDSSKWKDGVKMYGSEEEASLTTVKIISDALFPPLDLFELNPLRWLYLHLFLLRTQRS